MIDLIEVTREVVFYTEDYSAQGNLEVARMLGVPIDDIRVSYSLDSSGKNSYSWTINEEVEYQYDEDDDE